MSARTAVDLFSGAGGASLGLVQAGFDLRLAAEVDPGYAATHEANLPGAMLRGDLRDVDARDVADRAGVASGHLDLLFAGPPCQGFSAIGPRVVWDERNNLFREVIRLATALRPHVVVIENVPGLVTLARGAYLRSILAGLTDAGYEAGCAELLAAQYGAPQMRWRLIVVAWRRDLGIAPGFGFPAPTHGSTQVGDLLPNVTVPPHAYEGLLTTRAAIGDLPAVEAGGTNNAYSGRPRDPFQRAARTRLDGTLVRAPELHDHDAPAMSPQNLARIRALAPGQDWRDLPRELLPPSMQRALLKDHTRRYRRMTWDGVPRAVITRFRDPKSGEYTHPDQDRTITIREAARIQGFPDWFAFSGTRASRYEQVGNAVPVPLARAIAGEVMRCLDNRPGERLVDAFRRRPVPLLGRYGELANRAAVA